MTEDEFYDYLKPLEVYPWKFDREGLEDGPELYDFAKWDQTDLSDIPLGGFKLINPGEKDSK